MPGPYEAPKRIGCISSAKDVEPGIFLFDFASNQQLGIYSLLINKLLHNSLFVNFLYHFFFEKSNQKLLTG